MRQLLYLLIEFVLIIAVVTGLYFTHFSRKPSEPFVYNKPIIRQQADIDNEELKKELIFFLNKELGLYSGTFEFVDAAFLHTNDLTGADLILVTLRAPDGRLCQLTVSRSSRPGARWQLDREHLKVVEPLTPVLESRQEVPQWMQDLGVTGEQLQMYYAAHPEAAKKGELAFFDPGTGQYSLPADWVQTVFTLVIDKDKTMRLIADSKEKTKKDMADSLWESDYASEYVGMGYREYLYDKVKGEK